MSYENSVEYQSCTLSAMPQPDAATAKNAIDASTKTYLKTHIERREARHVQPNTVAGPQTDMSPEDWTALAEFLGTFSGDSIGPKTEVATEGKPDTVASTDGVTTETKDDPEESALTKRDQRVC